MRRYQLIPSHAVQTLIITTTSPITSGEVTLPYSFSFNAIGGTPPYTWSETGTLPTGFTLSSGGTLSGTPSATYASSFNVTVTDNIGSHYTASFNLTIVAAVSITTTSPLPNATESSSYSYTMAATGGFTPYTWSLLSSTGSNSWSVSPTGVITGLPGSVEIDTLDIQVVDALGVPSAANFNLTVSSSTGGSFNYFISTTGNDSNNGLTPATAWAITALNSKQATYGGQRLGLIAGTYDISGNMVVANETVFGIAGGPNSSTPTYIASCDASGNYSRGVATLDCKGASGIYGGVSNSTCYPFGPGAGVGPLPSSINNWTMDGLQFTGFGYNCISVGSIGGNGGLGPTSNVIIQNCTFHDGVNSQTTTHSAVIIAYDYSNLLISNCWFNNCTSPAADQNHFSTINLNGQASRSINGTITLCTFSNSPGIYGIVDQGLQSGTTVEYCYFDLTQLGVNFNDGAALQGLSNNVLPGSQAPSSFHHNITKGGTAFFDAIFAGSPAVVNFSFYNNSWDLYGQSVYGIFGNTENPGQSHLFTCYNNLMWDNGATFQGALNAGYIVSNVDGFSVLDYNIYGTLNKFVSYPANGGSGTTTQTFASWKTATGGDVHSSTNATNPYTNNGTYALQYQVQSGSVAFQTGRIGGTSGGAVCNVGAWDGIVTQIGCNFAV